MKSSSQIVKWGKIKPFFDKHYNFNTIDIETVNNELYLFGYTSNGKHVIIEESFYNEFHLFLIDCVQSNKDILTWSRYDNTHLMKLIFSIVPPQEINHVLERIGKVSPIIHYQFDHFIFSVENIIKDSIIFKVDDLHGASKTVTLYNLKNLYDTNLETTAKNYGLDYYSKLGQEFHLIDPKRYETDQLYQLGCIEANRLDNVVLLDIAYTMLKTFKSITGNLPKSIFTNGSLARSYLLSQIGTFGSSELNFKMLFGKQPLFKKLLDYSMRSYHGGKIESYVLGFIPKAKIIDITSAYPYAMSLLPKLTNRIHYETDQRNIKNYFYAFIDCEIKIDDPNLIHPVLVENPINKSNISPYGYMKAIITKIEYDYLIKKGALIQVYDFIGIESNHTIYPYREIVQTLFDKRMLSKLTNISLSMMFKIILNSLYGITFELTDVYREENGVIKWIGYRAGDYFNPVIASYITAITRTYLSDVSHNVIENGGKVFLNMTDSIIYEGEITRDVFSEKKVLGKFEEPTPIENVYILGAGRYEYKDEITKKYTIKSRGFNVSVKDQSYYGELNLEGDVTIEHKTFVTSFKASTRKYAFQKMGYLIDDTYNINPFNVGGKRIIENRNVNLNKAYTRTLPVYLERGLKINEEKD